MPFSNTNKKSHQVEPTVQKKITRKKKLIYSDIWKQICDSVKADEKKLNLEVLNVTRI